ncbi:photosystem I reaction center subunit PsaK [Gloeocapsa sp. PCC 73106]|uniref:photosystem I reaction center subunit PsaK n=1 Tax=Gloeocapsa sp. PCC 73106 TaxID=102232 RepID=UPI0002AC4A74|nr:photosystem I reaction center subunit PsaK [Gloeocapsa sp. PCC 73106]ELR97166.1 photosystem I reaction center subunit PsaK [Gloeocapsa sp. PCC 73106]
MILAAIPQTSTWSFSVALVMILANLFAIAVGRFAIKSPGVGPDLPVNKPGLWRNFGIPELLATASLGHILGAGMILGLSNAGVL